MTKEQKNTVAEILLDLRECLKKLELLSEEAESDIESNRFSECAVKVTEAITVL